MSFNGNSRKEVSLKVEQTSRLKFSNCIEHVNCEKCVFSGRIKHIELCIEMIGILCHKWPVILLHS